MQLTKLELYGFKSFAEKTEFAFGPGITAVVGPNGCGKSNIVDAMKWVLGEQGTKSLRASDMTDVIFSGNNNRPSLGYAEASVVISNNKGILPLEYQEVCITRRLYASGESEYYLNKQLCRLRDIKDLFMDTGLGADCYSLIEQGEVDVLLQANAQERRVVFEEAAGISKYRTKKKAALSRLEKIDQNLLRLGDIIEEVQKQSRSIKLQAAKARRYKEHTERLKELKVQWALKNFQELYARQSEVASQIEELLARDSHLQEERESLEKQREALEEKINQTVEKLSQIRAQEINQEAEVARVKDKTSLEVQKIHGLELQKARLTEHMQVLEEKIKDLEGRSSQTKEALRETTQEIDKSQETLARQEGELYQINQECLQLEKSVERKKSQAMEAIQCHSRLQNEWSNIIHEKETLENRKTRIEERLRGISQELESLGRQRQALTQDKTLLDSETEELERRLRESTTMEAALKVKMTSLEGLLSEKKQLFTAKQSRQEVLRDFEARAAGVETGTKTVLEETSKNLRGICGIVADKLKVDLPNAQAIEAALGPKAQAVITQTTQDALQAITLLEDTKKGRATFLPMDCPERRQGGTTPDHDEGVVARAVELVNPTEHYLPLLKKLLERTIVAKDLPSALTLSRKYPETRVVTLKGETLDPDGSIAGGCGMGQPGLITRRSELENIEGELAEITKAIETLEADKKGLQKEGSDLQTVIAGIKTRLEEGHKAKLTKEGEIRELELRLKVLREENAVTDGERSEIDCLLQKHSLKEASLKVELEDACRKVQEIEREVETLSGQLSERQSRRATLDMESTELKISLAGKREKRQSLTETLSHIEENLREAQGSAAADLEERKECEETKIMADREIERLNALIRELEEKRQKLLAELAANEEVEKEAQAGLSALSGRLREKDQEHNLLQNQLQELRLKEKEFQIKRCDLEDRIKEEYQVELSRLQPQEVDWTLATQEMEELKTKIERLGNVNLEALQEQDQLEIREKFLLNQREDLLKAKNSLDEIIRRINQTSRELFAKSFEEIGENFNAMFRKLFGGGRANIFLEENVDILEAGIEIVAQPPGKELRSISLLSGGEKSMTAVALLFAIFQTKPSPFCILDEVDAALDESNVNRFTHVLKEFTQNSQFIIITHNKLTMTVADSLYGITMEESGVSKKVAVKLEEVEKQKTLAPAA